MRRLALIALAAAGLTACEHGRGYVAGDRAVAAVVEDEAQRQKVAAAAEAGAGATDAMAVAADGPKVGRTPPH